MACPPTLQADDCPKATDLRLLTFSTNYYKCY